MRQKQEILRYQDQHELSVRAVAKLYHISPTCVSDWRKKLNLDIEYGSDQKTLHTGRPVYTGETNDNVEHLIIEYVEDLRSSDQAVTVRMCRIKVLQLDPEFLLCGANNKCSPEGQTDRVKDWIYRFLDRNDLSIRRTTHVAQKNCSVEKCIDAVSLMNRKQVLFKIPPDLLINMDQTAVYFDSRPSYTIADKGAKTVAIAGTSTGDQRATVFLAVTATGRKLPPFIVYKGVRGGKIEKEFTASKFNYPEGQFYAVQEKGWTDTEIMLLWVNKVLKPFLAENMKDAAFAHLILDSFRVHYVNDVVSSIQELGCLISYIPGGGTSKIQVLDVGVNKPFKNNLQNYWTEWMVSQNLNGSQKVSRVDAANFIEGAWSGITKETIVNTWKKINFAIY
jgi:hypothetical protein